MALTQTLSSEEHAHIGAAFRSARTKRGESLETAAKALHVQARYLRAIEALDKDPLPSLGYAVGYVRSYAAYLGFDAQAAVQQFKTDIECPQSLGARMGISGNPHHVSRRKIRLPRGSFAAVTALSCAAVVVSWYGMKSDANSAPSVLKDTPAATQSLEAIDTAVETAIETGGQSPAQNWAFAPIQPKQDDPASISLKALGPSWVHVTDKDGLVLLSRVMVPGEIFETNRERAPLVNVRDAGAIELYLGGAAQGPLGRKGENRKAVALAPVSPVSEQ